MGVPALFRWLSSKYGKIATTVVEEKAKEINGIRVPVDVTKPNPNGEEFDNLYLDMNGIIHPCCHPEDKPAPASEDEMMVAIFEYIDRIITMIRPRKVLYMAIDGVAPRAKMNQQRSRRFRASQEAQEKAEEEERLRKEWEAAGNTLPEKEQKPSFDSNCITPGTPFMSNLATALRYYIADRLNSDLGWRNLKIILSDASVPGEGEHKIMDFIRRERCQPQYDSNTSHILYGLDADLIMLALATHELHFKILREDVFFNQNDNKGCFICGQTDHQAAVCTGEKKQKIGAYDEKSKYAEKPYVFLHVGILREYLEAELRVDNLPFRWDLERAIDDWVFLCFFVGNDFLPHLPSLEIREGAIDRLIEIWKRNLPTFGGYLTNSGEIDLYRVQILLSDLGLVEDEIFVQRRQVEERKMESRRRRKREQRELKERTHQRDNRSAHSREAIADAMMALPSWTPEERAELNKKNHMENVKSSIKLAANKAAADDLRRSLLPAATISETAQGDEAIIVPSKRKADNLEVDGVGTLTEDNVIDGVKDGEADEIEDDDVVESMTVADVPVSTTVKADVDSDAEPEDNVRLWEPGWKQRYYSKKFNVDSTDKNFIREVVTKYVEGFSWVLKYYYQGVQSWKWFFPYHYAPFASDFDFIGDLKVSFVLGEPFKPIEQLMGVLPAASRSHVPSTFHKLMTDSDSPIIDFYPLKFPIDLNGKKYAWQGVALLPFINEERLFQAMDALYDGLTEEEKYRNSRRNDVLFCGKEDTLYERLCSIYGKRNSQEAVSLDPKTSSRLLGNILPDPEVTFPGMTLESPLQSRGLPDISDNQSISVLFLNPEIPKDYVFLAEVLPTASHPKRVLNHDDIYWVKLGGKPSRGRGRGRGGSVRGGAAGRFIRHGIGQSGMGPDGLPYMGGGGYNIEGSSQSEGVSYRSTDNFESRGGGYGSQYSNRVENDYRNDYGNSRRNRGDNDYNSRSQSRYDNDYNSRSQSRYGISESTSIPLDQRYSGRDDNDGYRHSKRGRFDDRGPMDNSESHRAINQGPTYINFSNNNGHSSYASGSYTNMQRGGGYVPNTSMYGPPSGLNSSSQYGSLYNQGSPPAWMSELPGLSSAISAGRPLAISNVRPPIRPPPSLAWNRNVDKGKQ